MGWLSTCTAAFVAVCCAYAGGLHLNAAQSSCADDEVRDSQWLVTARLMLLVSGGLLGAALWMRVCSERARAEQVEQLMACRTRLQDQTRRAVQAEAELQEVRDSYNEQADELQRRKPENWVEDADPREVELMTELRSGPVCIPHDVLGKPHLALKVALSQRRFDLSVAIRAATQMRERDYSLRDYFQDCCIAFPELILYVCEREDAPQGKADTSSGVSGHEECVIILPSLNAPCRCRPHHASCQLRPSSTPSPLPAPGRLAQTASGRHTPARAWPIGFHPRRAARPDEARLRLRAHDWIHASMGPPRHFPEALLPLTQYTFSVGRYKRTLGALFAVYWLARIGIDGERGFCFGVDDEWVPRNPPTLGEAERDPDLRKRLRFYEEQDWPRMLQLLTNARLLFSSAGKAGDDGKVHVHIDRMVAMLALTAVHDVMKVEALLPQVAAEHAPYLGYQAGDVINDHDIALGYVLTYYGAHMPSFHALPREQQRTIRFTQSKMAFNHGWLVQAEAPPKALLGPFKQEIRSGGAQAVDIAFYFVHWLTDLAGGAQQSYAPRSDSCTPQRAYPLIPIAGSPRSRRAVSLLCVPHVRSSLVPLPRMARFASLCMAYGFVPLTLLSWSLWPSHVRSCCQLCHRL